MSDLENDGRLGSLSKDQSHRIGRRKSNIWRKFTIVNHKDSIASCDVCGCKLSFKSTVNNLKKHIQRKHNYDVDNACLVPFKPKGNFGSGSRPSLSSIGGLEGLLLNVVADEGEDPLGESVVAEEVEVVKEIYHEDEMHNYCDMTGVQEEVQTEIRSVPRKNYNSQNIKVSERSDKIKKSRIMDMQLECLEIKKYNMQMEALLLENQLNLPRSIFTEPLRRNDVNSRGTQTDIGGNNTKVFYVSDSSASKEGAQHFFTFRASLNE